MYAARQIVIGTAISSGIHPSTRSKGMSWKGTAAKEENAEQVRLRVDRMELWIVRSDGSKLSSATSLYLLQLLIGLGGKGKGGARGRP